MKLHPIFLIIAVIILASLSTASDYLVDENMDLRGNDIHNATWVNSTNLKGDLESEYVKSPPSGCSSGYAMTEFVLNFSTVTCSQFLTVADNTSMKNYVDAQDVVYNDSMKTYVDAQDTTYNTSMKTYVDDTFITQTDEGNLNVNSSAYVTGFTGGSIPYADASGKLTENNTHLYYDASNGGALAVGDNSDMRNMFQAVKEEGITNVDNVKALIASRNKGTTNNNWAGYSMQTEDTDGDVYSGARILTQFTNHSVGAISGDLVIDTRNAGTRTEKFRILASGNVGIGTSTPTEKLDVNGNITSLGLKLDDDKKTYYGTGTDSCIYYNGTALIISTVAGDCS